MKKSYEILKEAISSAGTKSVAADMGLSQSMIYKWCQPSENENSSGADNPLDRLLEICRLTGDETLIDWLCQKTDSFRVKNTSSDTNVEQSVLRSTQVLLKEFSDVLEAFTESYADDQKIDTEESARIRKEWDELKSIGEQLVCACEQGVFSEM